jgi:uncharacterized protein (DUF1684 family)
MDPQQATDLLDWRRRTFGLYERIRTRTDPLGSWHEWRRTRDDMLRSHPQSPLPQDQRSAFAGLPYFEYDHEARVLADVEPEAPDRYEIGTSGDEPYSFTRFGRAGFTFAGRRLSLELYWLEAYGGGLFLPFRDAAAGNESYGAGRYLLDTVKGADLGTADGKLLLDFNFAYNPSCAYDPRWVCPLAPPPNRLDIAIRAGERVPS